MNRGLEEAWFGFVDRIRGERILERLEELRRTDMAGVDTLRAIQVAKLRAVLAHAKRSVPHYRDLLGSIGFDPAGVRGVDDLASIPPVEKAAIVEQPARFLSEVPGEPCRWDVTSGSTGAPMRFCRTASAGGLHRALNLRALGWYGVAPGASQARVWGVPILFWPRQRERLKDRLLNRRRYSSFETDEGSVDLKLRALARQRPDYVYGYPSAIDALAQRILRRGESLLRGWRPRVVMTTAEMLFPEQRENIGRAFGCPVANEYGASELTVIAVSCPAGRMHVSAEAVLVEFEPAPLEIDGGPAFRLLVTDLTNLAMPFVRYRIGDLGRPVADACPCGRSSPVVEILGGREVDTLLLPGGGRIHGSVFSYLGKSLLIAGGVRGFRVSQTALDRVEVEIARGPSFDPSCLHAFREEMRRRAGDALRIEFRDVPAIVPEPSGKLRYFRGLVAARDGGGAR